MGINSEKLSQFWRRIPTFFFPFTPDFCTYSKGMNHCVQELSYYSQQGKQKEPMLLYYEVKLSSDPTPYFSIGAVRSAVSSSAAMRMVAGSRPVLVIAWEWHIGLALLCSCSGALEYPITNSCGPINKSLSLSLSLFRHVRFCNRPKAAFCDLAIKIWYLLYSNSVIYPWNSSWYNNKDKILYELLWKAN